MAMQVFIMKRKYMGLHVFLVRRNSMTAAMFVGMQP